MPESSLIVDRVLDLLDDILDGPLDELGGHLEVLNLRLDLDPAHKSHEISHLKLFATFCKEI